MTNQETNKPVTIAILRSGLVPNEVLDEMKRWGLPVCFADETKPVLKTAKEVVECIREAIEDDATVKIRDTDLDVLSVYLNEHDQGHLVVFDPVVNKAKRVSCTYALLPNGRYVIPWTAEYIGDVLTDPKSYLRDLQGKHIHFDDVEELFFGGRKAFMSARPVQEQDL
jgi:hypothetical protein